ncbi:hypothetical protein [Negativibacillus massiliensis]|uniref:hypothetical protein n=1 Tax=Negativibacillus massiliensis TaxID=1871035 RepID=UPI003AF20A1A
MSEVKMVNFNPQKVCDVIAQILGDRYGVDLKIIVHPKENIEIARNVKGEKSR